MLLYHVFFFFNLARVVISHSHSLVIFKLDCCSIVLLSLKKRSTRLFMGAKCYKLNGTFQKDDSIYFTLRKRQYSGLPDIKGFKNP